MCVDGWIPVDPLTLETSFPASTRWVTSRASGHRRPACSPRARRRSSPPRSSPAPPTPSPATTYDGKGICYLEFGRDQVAKVEVTFVSGQMPNGKLEGPSSLLAEDKEAFGTDRIRRWFDRSWSLG